MNTYIRNKMKIHLKKFNKNIYLEIKYGKKLFPKLFRN